MMQSSANLSYMPGLVNNSIGVSWYMISSVITCVWQSMRTQFIVRFMYWEIKLLAIFFSHGFIYVSVELAFQTCVTSFTKLEMYDWIFYQLIYNHRLISWRPFEKEDRKINRQRFTPDVCKSNATAKRRFESIFVELYKCNLGRLIIYYADSIVRLNGELDD